MTPKHSRFGHFREARNDKNFYLDPQQRAFLRSVVRVAAQRPVTVGLRGPTGAGKTSVSEWLAANALIENDEGKKVPRPYFILDCPTIREPKDVFGFKDVEREVQEDGEVVSKIIWRKSGFVHAIRTPHAVVVLDEATRIHPSAMNGLMPLLDHRRMVYIDELDETIEVAEGVIFFLTANIGIDYTGTWAWDKALENRIDYQLDVGYLPAEEEVKVLVAKTGIRAEFAEKMVQVANTVRKQVADESSNLQHAISLRQLLAAAELAVASKLTNPGELLDALEFTVIPNYSAEGGTESDRAVVMEIARGIVAPNVAKKKK